MKAFSNKKIIPDRLREARIARGLSMQELAEKVNITRQSISQYELGDIQPSAEMLLKLVKEFQLPLAFFYKEINIPNEQLRTIFFRSLKSTDKASREMFKCRAEWLNEIYNYLNEFIKFPKFDMPDIYKYLDNKGIDHEKIEDISLTIRRFWDIGFGPIGNLTNLFEKKGFIITFINHDQDKIDAFSQWRGDRPFIFLNKFNRSAVRLRFDLAHELGHILLHSDIDQEDLYNKQILDKIEKEANYFAGAFLLPRDTFVQDIVSTSFSHLKALKEKWRVSIAAIIQRASNLNIFTDNQILSLNKKLSYNNWRKQEPLDDIIKIEEPVALKQSIELLLKNNIKSSYEITTDLSFGSKEIEELCLLNEGALSDNGNENIVNLELKRQEFKKINSTS
ncbi:MAG: helix-turn-helix domain-containing protein [Candidatus Humimicrobiaceae bacterium]